MTYADMTDEALAAEVERRGLAYAAYEARELGRARMIELLTELDSFQDPVKIEIDREANGKWTAEVSAPFHTTVGPVLAYGDTEHEAVIQALTLLLHQALSRMDDAIRDAEGSPI